MARCPDPGVWAEAFLRPDDLPGEIASHLPECRSCRESLAVSLGAEPPADPAPLSAEESLRLREVARVSLPAPVWRGRLAWAAALLVGAGAAAGVLWVGGGGRIVAVREGMLALGDAGARRVAAGEPVRTSTDGSIGFPDGTRALLAAGTGIEIAEPLPGERLRILLSEGEADVSVRPGRGAVVVRFPTGEARVTGTRFLVRAYAWALTPGDRSILGEVEVQEGTVEVLGSCGAPVPVRAGERADVPQAGGVVLQGAGEAWDDEAAERVAARLAEALRRGDAHSSGLALGLLRHAGGEGVRALVHRVLDAGAPESERLAWARMAGMLEPAHAATARESLLRSLAEGETALREAVASGGGP